jgi:hypothetical protein
MRRNIAAALAAVLLAACDGPLLFAEVEIPDLRVTLPPQAFPASGTGAPDQWCDPTGQTDPPCVQVTTSYDLAAQVPAINETGVTYEIRLTDVAIILSATPGSPSDLSGVVSAAVLVGYDPAVPGSGAVVASYARTAGATPTTIAVSGNANLDLAPYLSAGQLPVRVEVVVENGMPAFEANILAAFYVRIEADWGHYL